MKDTNFVPVQFCCLREFLYYAGLRKRHQEDLENLTLTIQPFKTLKFFVLAMVQYFNRSVLYLLAKGGWLMLLSTVVVAVGIVLVTFDGPHEKVLQCVEHLRSPKFIYIYVLVGETNLFLSLWVKRLCLYWLPVWSVFAACWGTFALFAIWIVVDFPWCCIFNWSWWANIVNMNIVLEAGKSVVTIWVRRLYHTIIFWIRSLLFFSDFFIN